MGRNPGMRETCDSQGAAGPALKLLPAPQAVLSRPRCGDRSGQAVTWPCSPLPHPRAVQPVRERTRTQGGSCLWAKEEAKSSGTTSAQWPVLPVAARATEGGQRPRPPRRGPEEPGWRSRAWGRSGRSTRWWRAPRRVGRAVPARRVARAAPAKMEAAGEAEEGAAGPGGKREGLRRLHPLAEMLDLPFLPFCFLLSILGLLCVAFVATWFQHWHGGFSWDGSNQTFNWHPVLMVTGLVVTYGAAALVYRLPSTWRGPKLPWKVLHGSLALLAFGLAVLGLVAVFYFHNEHGTANMYSLHSWVGLTTVLLFSCQWVAGFGAFLLPWAPTWLRALYKPIHVFFGSTILMLSVVSCVSGINEKLFFSLKNGTTDYKLLPAEAVFANTLGLLILLFGVLVVGALARPSWKRPDAQSLESCQPLLSGER